MAWIYIREVVKRCESAAGSNMTVASGTTRVLTFITPIPIFLYPGWSKTGSIRRTSTEEHKVLGPGLSPSFRRPSIVVGGLSRVDANSPGVDRRVPTLAPLLRQFQKLLPGYCFWILHTQDIDFFKDPTSNQTKV